MGKKLIIFVLAFGLGWAASFVGDAYLSVLTKTGAAVPQSSINVPEISHLGSDLSEAANPSEPPLDAKNAPRFWGAGVRNDREVLDLFNEFQSAIQRNDKKAAADLMEYPLRVNFPSDPDTNGYTFIKNKWSFIRLYDRIFNENLKRFIAGIDSKSHDDIWGKYSGIAVGRGVLWIGVFCYDQRCTGDRYYIKIRTIHGNSSLMELD